MITRGTPGMLLARGAFYPGFDHGGGVTPAAALQSSFCPDALLAFLMSTPEVRLAVAPLVVHPLPGSGMPLHHCAFSGDLIDSNCRPSQVGLKSVLDQQKLRHWTQPTFEQRGQLTPRPPGLTPWHAQTASLPKPEECFHHHMGMLQLRLQHSTMVP